MYTTLATKQDIDHLRLATKHDIVMLRQELCQDIRLLNLEMDSHFALLYQKFDVVELRLTVKLGSMLIAGFVLTIAALRFWT